MQGDLLRYSSGGEVGTAGHQQGHSSAWSEDTQVSPIPSVFCLPVTVYNWTYYLWHLRHQNIVVLMGYHVLDNISTIVTNYVRGGHSSWCRVCEGMGFFWHISMAILISYSCRSYLSVEVFNVRANYIYPPIYAWTISPSTPQGLEPGNILVRCFGLFSLCYTLPSLVCAGWYQYSSRIPVWYGYSTD